MRGKMMDIRKNTNDQVRGLLDDKQKEKFDKQEQEREDRVPIAGADRAGLEEIIREAISRRRRIKTPKWNRLQPVWF